MQVYLVQLTSPHKGTGKQRMKIRCLRFSCEVCQKEASIQVFFKKSGKAGYARARHYGADKKFHYHQQSLGYINEKLKELSVDLGQGFQSKTIDQNKSNPSLFRVMAGGEGFEPSTLSLEG
jgi:hypothetical protein